MNFIVNNIRVCYDIIVMDLKRNILELVGFFTLPITQYSKKLENTTFRKLDVFPFSREVGDIYSLGSLRKN
jgi:hypothetical protein